MRILLHFIRLSNIPIAKKMNGEMKKTHHGFSIEGVKIYNSFDENFSFLSLSLFLIFLYIILHFIVKKAPLLFVFIIAEIPFKGTAGINNSALHTKVTQWMNDGSGLRFLEKKAR